MPPDGSSDACLATSEEETDPMLKKKDVGDTAADLIVDAQQRWRYKLLPVKDIIKLLVFIDMLAVAIVTSLMTTYFKDLNIR